MDLIMTSALRRCLEHLQETNELTISYLNEVIKGELENSRDAEPFTQWSSERIKRSIDHFELLKHHLGLLQSAEEGFRAFMEEEVKGLKCFMEEELSIGVKSDTMAQAKEKDQHPG